MKYKNLTNSMLLAMLILTFVLMPTSSQAVVINDVANDGVTTAQITAALQGSGVTISNLVIVNNGCANRTRAVGLFSQGTTPTGPGPVLGDSSGVVLSTGPLKSADPLVSPNSQANWTNTLCGNVTDADMVQLEAQTSNGEYIAIEFDIIPTLPIMTIPFQFGSDEFPEYVCTAFNDVTGIFVSGPGINGPYSNNAENFAKTPGGDLTSINWVNTGVIGNQGTAARCGSLSNSAYYTDNSNGDPNGGNATVATTNSNLELDGWTNYIYQSINVVPGQSYHVKAAIADAGDRQWDSAVFFHLIFSSGTLPGFDFGDAPDTYRTLTASGGPRHGINSNIFLGVVQPDNEVTGQPTATADGDDTTDTDDEDGVSSFPPLSTLATSYSVDVTVNNTTGSSAQLLGWIDFNGNGVFDTAEGTSLNVPTGTVNGSATLTWSGLSGLPGGTTYARFRLTTDSAITTATPGGTATDGEVEDFTLLITTPDLSTSTKDWVDNNGGEQEPGDILTYTITIIDSGGGEATGVTLTDNIPINVNSFNLVSIPTGATSTWDASGGTYGNGLLTVNGINVPAGGSVTVVFEVTINDAVAIGTIIDNSASVINPLGPDGTPSAPPVTVTDSSIPVSGIKNLYLYDGDATPAHKLSRTPTISTTATKIDRGASRTWVQAPALAADLIIDPAISSTVPLYLVLRRADNDNGNRTIQVDLQCSSGGTILTDTVTVNLRNPRKLVRFDMTTSTPPWSSPISCAAGESWQLTVTNTLASNNQGLRIYPYRADLGRSVIELPASTVINVDNIDFYSDLVYPAGNVVTSLAPGDFVRIRSTVSDPFGTYDIITPATITITDPLGTVTVNQIDMSEIAAGATAATKLYEYRYQIPAAGPTGIWNVRVDAVEGTEGSVTDYGLGAITVTTPMPLLTIMKSASSTGAAPGDTITYTVTVLNSGASGAYQVTLRDDLGNYTLWGVDSYGAGQPFLLTQLAVDPDGGGPLPADSGVTLGTPVFYDSNGNVFTPVSAGGSAPTGYDSRVDRWELPMSGIMVINGQFRLQYQVMVE